MVGCCAYRCKSRSEKKVPGLTFHRFPLKDPQRTDHWIQKLHIANWSPTKNDRICSKHFEDNLFYRIGNRICLKDEAMPTIFPELPKYLQQKPQPKRDRSFRKEVISQPSTSQADSQSDASRPLTPVRALEVVLEEINSSSRSSTPTTSPEFQVDDVPRKVFSKRKLSEKHKKDILRSKKIRYLKKKGGGQKKKINNSEGVLLNLKKENLEENGETQIRQDPLQSLPLAPSAGINTINSNSPGNIIFVNLSTHKTEPEESESELIGLPTVSNEPPFCIVCNKREDEDDGSNRSFHMFPRASNTYILWLCILNCDKSAPLKANARVCSDHFLAQHFVTNSDGIRYLSEAALPIVTLKSKLSEEPIRNLDTNPAITRVSQVIKPDGGLKGNESYDTEEIILVECNDMSAAPAQDSLIVNESTQVENKTEDDIVEQMPRGNETSTVPRYAEGCRLSDLSGLRTEKHNWEKANKAIIKQRNKIRSLHRLNRRLQAKVDQLSMSVTYLEGKLLRCTCTAETALEKFD